MLSLEEIAEDFTDNLRGAGVPYHVRVNDEWCFEVISNGDAAAGQFETIAYFSFASKDIKTYIAGLIEGFDSK